MSTKKQQEATNLEEVGYEIPEDEYDISGGSEINLDSTAYVTLEESIQITMETAKKNNEQKEMERQIDEAIKRTDDCIIKAKKSQETDLDLKTFFSFVGLGVILFGLHIYSQLDNERTIFFIQQDLAKVQRDLKMAKSELIEIKGEKAQKILNDNLPILNELPLLNDEGVQR